LQRHRLQPRHGPADRECAGRGPGPGRRLDRRTHRGRPASARRVTRAPKKGANTVKASAPRTAASGAAAALAAVLLATTGCTASGGRADLPAVGDVDLGGGSIADDFDLEGAELSVSSKEFTESVVLGKITYY